MRKRKERERWRSTEIKTTVQAKDTFKNVVRLKKLPKYNTTQNSTVQHRKKTHKNEWNEKIENDFFGVSGTWNNISLKKAEKNKVDQEKGKK